MSDLDLTAAVDAARDAWGGREVVTDLRGKQYVPPVRDGGLTAACIDAAVTAAAPLIERQVRERLAAEIEAMRGPAEGANGESATAYAVRAVWDEALAGAARIARGEAS